MFRKSNDEDKQLQEAIDRLYEMMANNPTNSESYSQQIDQLTKLYALKDDKSKSRVSPDVLVTAAANLLGIAIIVGHERAHVVTSKALAFAGKLR